MGAPLLVVTPWYPHRGTGSLLDVAVAGAVDAAARAGADVTVVHLVPEHQVDDAADSGTAPFRGARTVTVRRVVVPGGIVPGNPDGVEAVAAALAEGVPDLLGAASLVHAHAAVPVAAAVARVVPDDTRLVVGEHLPSAIPLLVAAAADAPLAAAWRSVLARADVVLAPTEDLARRLAGCLVPTEPTPPRARFEVLPYAGLGNLFTAAAGGGAPDSGPTGLPATRWLLVGPAAAAEPVVRALAADALAGAPTTLTAVADEGDEALDALSAVAARLGVEPRIVRVAPRDALGVFAGAGGVDLAVGADPSAAADPALTAAFAAGVPAVLARAAGSEDLVDEVAATGAVRLLRPGSGVIALLEAVADLRRAGPGGSRFPAGLLPPWLTSPERVARLLAHHYGETVAPVPAAGLGPRWPRVLLVDLVGEHRNEIGRLAKWIVEIGGEPVVVTAAAPPPSAGVAGAVTVDLRPVERQLTGPALGSVRRRLPGIARPALDGALAAYRSVRRPPTLVDAALAGPLAPGAGPSPVVAAALAADPASAELARRWAGGSSGRAGRRRSRGPARGRRR